MVDIGDLKKKGKEVVGDVEKKKKEIEGEVIKQKKIAEGEAEKRRRQEEVDTDWSIRGVWMIERRVGDIGWWAKRSQSGGESGTRTASPTDLLTYTITAERAGFDYIVDCSPESWKKIETFF